MSAGVVAALAVMLDWITGEPRRFHPLVGFGRMADAIEARLYGPAGLDAPARRLRGLAALTLALLPAVALSAALAAQPALNAVLSLAVLWLAIGHRSLHQHALEVAAVLDAGDALHARELAGRIVSRDVDALDPASATIESVLENGNDAILGALLWFAVAGAPGALAYRLANTLDAMWGYRSARYLHFGRAAARLDDALNWLPARLTALSYALLGSTGRALASWRRQAGAWDSPNAGPVMAAGAGALGLRLGGPARYRGEWQQRGPLGAGARASAADIRRALTLVRNALLAWIVIGLLCDVLLAP